MTQEMRAADVMETDVMSVAPELTISDLERLLMEAQVGGVPVVEGEKVVGIISRSDIVRHLAADQSAEAIATEYYWDMGGTAALRGSTRDATAADARLIEAMLDDLCVADLMVTEVVSVGPDQPISEVARIMADRHVHRILVVEGEVLRGVITTMDLARLLADGHAVASR